MVETREQKAVSPWGGRAEPGREAPTPRTPAEGPQGQQRPEADTRPRGVGFHACGTCRTGRCAGTEWIRSGRAASGETTACLRRGSLSGDYDSIKRVKNQKTHQTVDQSP